MEKFCIVTASHNEQILIDNLMTSPIIEKYPIITKKGWDNIPKAYNSIHQGEITMFVHHDVYIPEAFEDAMLKALSELPDTWGVIGSAGVRWEDKRLNIGYINDRHKNWGSELSKIEPVQTLDELLLIVNHKNLTRENIKFDEQFPQDFYGADLCMQCKDKGLGVYVFPGAYVHHNSSRPVGGRTESFYESEKKFKAKWAWVADPIVTTCSIIK